MPSGLILWKLRRKSWQSPAKHANVGIVGDPDIELGFEDMQGVSGISGVLMWSRGNLERNIAPASNMDQGLLPPVKTQKLEREHPPTSLPGENTNQIGATNPNADT